MLDYLTINTVVEIICLIIAWSCLKNDKSLAWKSLIVFLLIICITEMFGAHLKKIYLADRAHATPNVWLYNLLLVFQIGFTSYFFQHLLHKYSKSKPVILSGLALLLIVYSYETFDHGILKYNNLTNIVMSYMFVAYSLYYYYCLIKDDKYVNLKSAAAFWWVAGVLFFYFGRTACVIFFGRLSQVMVTQQHNLTYYIYIVLNIILYSCWAYSFICRKWLSTK